MQPLKTAALCLFSALILVIVGSAAAGGRNARQTRRCATCPADVVHSLKPTTYLIRRAQSLLPPGSDAAPGFEPPPHSTAPVLVEEPAPQTQALPPRRRWWEDRAPEAMYAAAQLTVAEAPWLFRGALGRSKRAREQLQMRKQSGFMPRDSALPPGAAANRSAAVLTGTAFHSRGPGCPGGCSGRGVCAAQLGRCDCEPYAWGADCSVAVVTQTICVYNDSAPWFCDKPSCVSRTDEFYTLGGARQKCVGEPLTKCPRRCSGRGRCVRGSCACSAGFGGISCDEPVEETKCMGGCSGRGRCLKGFCLCRPPYWGIDCKMGGGGEPRCTARPCVYVYELPARMNVLSLKAEHDWREQYKGRKFDYRMPPVFHEALLSSAHRTSVAEEADAFYVPTWDFQGAWGNPEVYYRAHRYVSTFWPYWNRSGGTDHVFAIARDAAACSTPWGSLREELAEPLLLSNWGGVTGLSGREEERCFRPGQDLVLPGTLTHETVAKSPFWLPAAARAAQMAKRTTQLFFRRALCWKTDQKAYSEGKLDEKCKRSYGQAGFLSRYSFGLRYDVWRLHRSAPGFKILATDYPPSLPKGRVNVNEEILGSKFCLCPSGTGWGMRVFHVMVLGCVPVLVQHDGEHPPVAQAFEPEVLDWHEFAVAVEHDEVKDLPQILEGVDLAAKQAALARVWARMVWRGALREPLRSRLPGPDAFNTTIAALAKKVGSTPKTT